MSGLHVFSSSRCLAFLHDLVEVYKRMNNLTHDYLRERFKQRSEIHQRNTNPAKERAYVACPSAGSRWGKELLLSVPKFLILYLRLLAGHGKPKWFL